MQFQSTVLYLCLILPWDGKERGLEEQTVELLRVNAQLQEEISGCRRAQQVLLATNAGLKRLLASSPVVIYSRKPTGDRGITFVSESILQFGYQPRQFLADRGFWAKCIHPEDLERIFAKLLCLPEQGAQICEYRFLHQDGTYRWIQDQFKLIRDETGKVVEVVGSWQDITEGKYREQKLFQEKELAQAKLQSIGDAVITTDALGKIEALNPMAEQITGWRVCEVKGLSLAAVFKTVNESTLQPAENPVEKVLRSGQVVESAGNSLLIARDGTEYAVDGSAAPIRDRKGQIIGTVLVFRDVTQPRNLARQLSWQANHDPLTGLVNRRGFEQQLVEAIASAKEKGQQHLLCYLDLDQFKFVNDTCGHIAGDELLRQLAFLLHNQVRSTDTLARLGGDEFAILINQCPLETGRYIADKIRKTIRDFRFVWQDHPFTIGASIGLVVIDVNSHDLNSILSAADAACYAAKDNGRNRVHLYQANDVELARQRGERQWLARINRTLEENRFRLYWQPIAPITKSPSTRGKHYEVLLRMVDEVGELLPPMAFIPAAERYGLMPALDRWTISTFLANYKRHSQKQLAKGKSLLNSLYTINLSGASINDDKFLPFLKEQFALHQVLPQAICFEITETVAIANLTQAVHFIGELKQLGCCFALDDFGSGMSSFAYLKHLTVDYLKIDGNFVKDIVSDPIDRAMVECINRLGHAIGIQTIAECVENEAILEKLRELGVDYAQGYGIAKPCLLPFNFRF